MKDAGRRIETLLERAWCLRLSARAGQAEACRKASIEIARALKLPAGAAASQLLQGPCEALLLDWILFRASLLRLEGRSEESWTLVEEVREAFTLQSLESSFNLDFQLGLREWSQGRFAEALEHFLRARAKTAPEALQIAVAGNLLLCLEGMGMPLDQSLAEFRALLKKYSGPRAYVAGAENALKNFELQQAWASGRLDLLQGATGGDSPQSAYLREWTAALPFHAGARPSHPRLEALLGGESALFCGEYRRNTLLGRLEDKGGPAPRATEFCDRLYLWTWRRLVCHPLAPTALLCGLFDSDPLKSLRHLSAGDFQMLRNALGWLALFDPAARGRTERLLRALEPPRMQALPLLRFEARAIACFEALRRGQKGPADEALALLQSDPLAQLPSAPDFAALVQGQVPPASPLASLRASLVKPGHVSAGKDFELSVDTGNGRIVNAQGASLISEALARSLALLAAQSSASFLELSLAAFDVDYRPIQHQSRMGNLITRLRQLAPPELKFKVRSERLYAEGSFARVRFVNESDLGLELRRAPQWRGLGTNADANEKAHASDARTDRWIKPALVLKQLRGQKEMRREEIEKLTGKSRATANRLIERWLRSGVLTKSGSARKTRYRFASE